MQHKGQLTPSEKTEVESIFEILNRALPTPPEVETAIFKDSTSWFKKDSIQFVSFSDLMKRAARVLQARGHEILVLESNQIQSVLYEDLDQVLVKAGSTQFQTLPAVF